MLTLQEIFNRAYIGMMKQQCKAYDKQGFCSYEMKSGNQTLRCGWGMVLGEHAKDCPSGALYRDDDDISPVNIFSKKVLGDMEPGWSKLGTKIQDIHDNLDVCMWQSAMIELAECFNLTVPTNIHKFIRVRR